MGIESETFQKSPSEVLADRFPDGNKQIAEAQFRALDSFLAAIAKAGNTRGSNFTKALDFGEILDISLQHWIDPTDILSFLADENTINNEKLPDNMLTERTKTLAGLKKDYYQVVTKYIMPALNTPNAIMSLARRLAEAQYNSLKDVDIPSNSVFEAMRIGSLRAVLRCTTPN